jgi:type I restriction enzyme S subunit
MASEWPLRPLAEMSVNFDTQRKPVKEAERVAGPYPYYGASGIVDHVNGYLFDGDYLLVAEDGENLRTRNTPIAFRATGKFWVNNHAHILQGNENASTRYLEYALLAADITPYLTGAVMPKLTQGNLNKIELPCPSLEEQRAIAEILGALDDRIDNLRQTNATLEAIAAALFKSWFVDFDGVAKEDMQESELGLIPKGWRIASVGEYFNLTMGQSPPGDTYNETNEGVPFYQGRADFGIRFPTERVYCTAPTRLARKGDVLVSVRAPVGDMNVALNDCAIGRGVAAVHYEHASFALYVLQRLKPAFKQFESEGTVFGSINKKQFEALQFIAPPDEVVQEFQAIVQPMDVQIENNARQAATLSILRDTLLPRLISGQLRIGDAARMAAEIA